MAALQEVTEELTNIRQARAALNLDVVKHPDELYMSLSEVESGGEALQDEDGYVGKMQIGDAYYKDAYEWIKPRFPDLVKDWMKPQRGARLSLRGDGPEPFIVAMAYFERYAKYHDYQPRRMAHMHKSGIGGARQVKKRIKKGDTEDQAFRWVSQNWRYTRGSREGKLIIPRAYLYVTGRNINTQKVIERRFDQCWADYVAWCEENAKVAYDFPKQCECTCTCGGDA